MTEPTPGGKGAARPDPRLVARGVCFGYGSLRIVDGASLQAGPGEVVALLGPNGAGKSTLVKGIAGQLPLLGGDLLLDGVPLGQVTAQRRTRRGIGYVPQLRDVFPTLTVWENLQMGGYLLSGPATRSRAEQIFDLFPALKAHRRRRASTLSGGERKMLGIARALMADPAVLILDEPTSNLSPGVAGVVLRDVVGRLGAAGHAVLMIEQRVEMALEVATWGYVMVQGQMRLDAEVQALRDAEQKLGGIFLAAGAQLPAELMPEGRSERA
jgi:branched-chain amino acid transport system ATP-binding protein